MKINKKTVVNKYTAEGAKASRISLLEELERTLMGCLLWEDAFYEDGISISERIKELVMTIPDNEAVANLAIRARNDMNLRHAPLWVARWLAKKGYIDTDCLLDIIIQRPDELTEFLALYWKDGKEPLSKKVKTGLAKAFTKFNEYQLAKYNRDADVKLRDVLFLCHAKPKDKEQEKLWKKLIDNTMTIPDTWETNLSAGKDKKKTWERLMKEKKLGGLALLRNLRNMEQEKVDTSLIKKSIESMNTERILPFRFITASRYAPKLEPELETAMFKCIEDHPKLPGKTILVVDTSGSMYGYGNVSKKSELTRVDAAAALAMLIREIAEEPVVYATAGNDSTRIHATKLLPPRKGFALRDLIAGNSLMSQIGGGGIFLTQCMQYIYDKEIWADRVIVITDEQDCDYNYSPEKALAFGHNNYIINISVEKNGIAYRKWTHINGFSEKIIDFILAYENQGGQ